MKMIVLHNPEDKSIVDFPIEEPKLDADENLIIKDGVVETTGKTMTWTLKSKETAKFPYYIADYLKKTFDFLEVKGDKEEKVKEQKGSPDICKGCGKTFKSRKGMALHWAAKHPEFLT